MSPFRAGLYFDQNCPIWQRGAAAGRREVPASYSPQCKQREGRHPALSQAKCLLYLRQQKIQRCYCLTGVSIPQSLNLNRMCPLLYHQI